MAKAEMVHGTFADGIPYLRFGWGPKTMLFLAGGPGNLVPSGFGASGFVRGMTPFAEEYTIYLVTRKSGLPPGYTTRDMAEDYAGLICDEFAGRVDLVMGVSYGGFLAQHLAADHPELFDHIVIAMSAHKVTDFAKRLDHEYAVLIGRHKDRAAMASRAEAIFPSGPLKPLLAGVLWLIGKPLLGKLDERFRSDVVIEADAEMAFDATADLARIAVPVLIAGGADDVAFPIEYMREMAELIPNSTLKIYEGGHTAAFMDKRFVADVGEFTSGHATG